MNFDLEVVRERLSTVRSRIVAAGGDDEVRILAVTKGFGVDAIAAAQRVGLNEVGENYAQEARSKFDQLDATATAQPIWHFIGHLQRNKVKLLAPFVDCWQSVDSTALIDEIAKRCPSARIFVEVNLDGSAGRSGCQWEDVATLVEHARSLDLSVQGLMGVAPMGDAEVARPHFRRLKKTANTLELHEISMGMSGDLEVAVQEGSTIVRVGSALFGTRPPRAAKVP